MSVDQITKPGSPARGDARLVQYDEYIDRQVDSTRRVVKLVDLATALVVLAGGMLGFLLVAAVFEHWVIPGGYSSLERAVLFTVLLAGVAYYSYRRLLPLVFRRVNPVYAAHAIEQTGPTLKNSLVNLLLFRQRRSEISDAVYRTLEEQAAHRLSRVPLDSAVDRSLLIRFGYFLLAVVAVAAAYKVFSPKDPIVAAQRVLMPWADIVPASRVSISDIKPGRVTVARGEFVDVSAQVDGIDDDETVVLRYTTEDGQAVDKSVPMRLSKDSMRFEGRLPNETSPGRSVGLAQNLSYRIEAGDARSLDYAIKVIDAPSILVEQVEYDYPEYTGLLDHKVESLGDIHAIEGTKIIIHARANGPLESAHIDFDADGRRDHALRADNYTATGSFVLALRDDRVTPQHASYVLRSTNREGQPNRNPVKYSIEVDRDHSPETSIVMPKERSLDVRLDETIAIAVEARDPDFGLADVRLRGEVQGRSVADVPLLKQRDKLFAGRYEFKPSVHGLKAGDVIQYWIVASDIRAPSPNLGESAKQTFRIVSPNGNDQPPPDRIAQRDPGQRGQPGEGEPQQGNEGQKGDGEQGGAQQDGGRQNDGQQDQPDDGQQAEGQQRDGKSGEGQPGEQQPQNGDAGQQDGQPDQGQQEGQQAEGGEGQPNAGQESQDSQGSKGEQANNDGGKSSGGQASQQPNGSGDQGEGQPNASAQQSGKGDGRQSENQQPQQGQGAKGARDSGHGESQQGGEAGANDQRKTGIDPSRQKSGKQTDGQSKRGQQQTGDRRERGEGQQSGEQESPVSSEGDNDGEAFERIQKHLQRNGELSDSESNGQQDPTANRQQESDGKNPGEQQAGDQQKGGQQDGERNSTAEGDQKSQKNASDAGAEKQNSPGERGDDATKGAGADTKGGDQQDREQQGGDKQQQNESPSGQQTSTKGEPGAGDEQKGQGSPNSQPEMKPSEKREQQPSRGGESNEQEPPAGARGKSESDSQGEQGGDRSGGGEEGGGQKAPRDGTGSAGQNQSADEGAGESSEKGSGNNSQNAGTDSVADGKTGQSSGETAGRGSKTRLGDEKEPTEKPQDPNAAPGAQGDKPKHREAPRAEDGAWEKDGAKSGKGESDGKKSDGGKGSSGKQGTQDHADQQGTPQGTGTQTGSGGTQSAPAGPPPQVDPLAAGDDEANLEYARKQTDMVLNKLADQLKQKKVDDKLLKQLGWSEDDLRRFVDRWQERKRAADKGDNEAGNAAKRELDDALRSLGLRPGQLRQGQVKDDSMRDLREGFRGPVPLEYQERLRAYNEGVSRGRPAEE